MNLAYEFIQILADMNFLRVFEFVADSLIFGERVPLSDSLCAFYISCEYLLELKRKAKIKQWSGASRLLMEIFFVRWK